MAQVHESFSGQRTAENGNGAGPGEAQPNGSSDRRTAGLVAGRAPGAVRSPGPASVSGPRALVNSGLFADASNFDLRYVQDYERIHAIVGALRTLGLKVVLTSGSFDILHEGHSMYLEAARHFGDFLIVGLDSDEKIKARKGPHRPAVPEMERLRMVTHQRGVGLVTLKHLRDERWRLIKTICPDVLVATADTYSSAEIAELEERYCGRVEVLERMATVSTSARLRRIQLGLPEPSPAATSPDPRAGGRSAQPEDPPAAP
jgi:rfaE bifunctional protein nucleotidyltransferase chain/domain